METIYNTAAAFVYDFLDVCGNSQFILFLAFSALTSAVCIFISRKHIKNILISYVLQNEIHRLLKNKEKKGSQDNSAAKYIFGAGYSVFAGLFVVLVKFLFCFAYACSFRGDVFDSTEAILFDTDLKKNLFMLVKDGYVSVAVIAFTAIAAILQFAICSVYENNERGDTKSFDYVSFAIMTLGLVFAGSGFAYVWIVTSIAELIFIAINKTILWEKNIEKTIPAVEMSLKQYDARLNSMADDARKTNQKKKK